MLNPAYAEHVAALAEIELALRGIAPYANSRNNLFKLSLRFPGQQWAKAGIHVSPHTPSGFRPRIAVRGRLCAGMTSYCIFDLELE